MIEHRVQGNNLVIASGGLDSTVLLYCVLQHDAKLKVISFNYGQRHVKELSCIKKTCKELRLSHKLVNIRVLADLMHSPALTGNGEVPEGHYTAPQQKLTVVPNRNAIMINLAAAYAITNEIENIWYAAHWNDRSIYPDCRWEYVHVQDLAIKLGNDNPKLELHAPFVHKTKADIVRIGIVLGVPFENTWSCYKGLKKACGKCGTCVERLEAFALCGIKDPIEYMKDEEST